MTDLQSDVALAADRAGAHATAPSLLLAALAGLGQLADSANSATDTGRLPFRVGSDWADLLGDLCHTIYLIADQTGVELDTAVRRASHRLGHGVGSQSRHSDAAKPSDWF